MQSKSLVRPCHTPVELITHCQRDKTDLRDGSNGKDTRSERDEGPTTACIGRGPSQGLASLTHGRTESSEACSDLVSSSSTLYFDQQGHDIAASIIALGICTHAIAVQALPQG